MYYNYKIFISLGQRSANQGKYPKWDKNENVVGKDGYRNIFNKQKQINLNK